MFPLLSRRSIHFLMDSSSRNSFAFPPDFAWGAATAAYQIEGACAEDGRKPSIWDVFTQTPGHVWENTPGDVACDHYNRWREDVALMRDLGLNSYRMSISWSRVIPEGNGKPNNAGLAFYDRLVDALLEAGVTPWVTLYHWDLPYALYCQRGWLNPDIPEWFARYTRVVSDLLSDRVTHWLTLNEPQCFIGLGLESGRQAPGLRMPRRDVLAAAHHALLAHGRAVQTLRELARKPPVIGWAPVGVVAIPDTNSPLDIEAARQAMFCQAHQQVIVNPWDTTFTWSNTWWSDPVFFGHYPEDSLLAAGTDAPRFTAEEMAIIAEPLDLYGSNIYHGIRVRAGEYGAVEKVDPPPGSPRTLLFWPCSDEALYWGPRLLQERYKLPFVVTENGASCHDWMDLDGKVQDPQRIDFLRRYLRQLARAIQDGVDIRGYFHWTLLDNFEWSEGYKHRLGLVYVDFRTQVRTPKSSFAWYRDVIATQGRNL